MSIVGVVPGVAGLLLTGGTSSRMGRDKARIRIGGEPLAERLGRVLARVADPVLEVGTGASGLKTVRESPPGGGPLAALGAGWEALAGGGHQGPVLALACDLPRVGEALLRLLASWGGTCSVVPLVDGRAQPLCARYSASALEFCVRHGPLEGRSLRQLLVAAPVAWAGPEVWGGLATVEDFDDLDSPEDLRQLGEAAH